MYGLYEENEKYLMPILIIQVRVGEERDGRNMQMGVIILMFVLAVLCFAVLIGGSDRLKMLFGEDVQKQINQIYDCEGLYCVVSLFDLDIPTVRTQMVALALVLYLLVAQVSVWFCSVMWGAYTYFRDKQHVSIGSYT